MKKSSAKEAREQHMWCDLLANTFTAVLSVWDRYQFVEFQNVNIDKCVALQVPSPSPMPSDYAFVWRLLVKLCKAHLEITI